MQGSMRVGWGPLVALFAFMSTICKVVPEKGMSPHMNAEFIDALDAMQRERGIDKDVLIDAIETALISAYKRNFGSSQRVRVRVDRSTGDVSVFALLEVVADDEVEDPLAQAPLTQAKEWDVRYEIGDLVEQEVTPRSFGRIAAQTAKQVVVQRIREAERGIIFDQYIEKEDEIMTAIVERVEKRNVYVALGRTEGFLAPNEQIPGEEYTVNSHIKVYVLEVRKTPKGPQVMVSRSHPGLVKRLFEMEVPEIQNGLVQVKSIAREAGFRTKIAVHSQDDAIDPLGACVGPKGNRVERVVEELHNEKIDIIKWSANPVEYVANALSPARVSMVQVFENEKAVRVFVPDQQLSLAIGREGQNVRLAAKLTNWKIDIKSESELQQSYDEHGANEWDEEEELTDE